MPAVFGFSASTVSRRFIWASARRLWELVEPDLSSSERVALFMDCKRFAGDERVIAGRVAMTGEKVIFGLVQSPCLAVSNSAIALTSPKP